MAANRYCGVEWHTATVARAGSLDVREGDLNQALPFADDHFRCVIGLSVLEHLMKPCAFLHECHRVLEPGGTLVILTPNISTYFTAALILAGRMPSSGPHPDSEQLLQSDVLHKISGVEFVRDVNAATPQHRHLVVFSFLMLRRYLRMLGFSSVHLAHLLPAGTAPPSEAWQRPDDHAEQHNEQHNEQGAWA